MSVFDNRRLDPGIFGFDYEKAAKSYYTDKYFENRRKKLEILYASGYRTKFHGRGFDTGWKDLNSKERDCDIAHDYYTSIRIVASGGFNIGKMKFFEEQGVPVDYYGV